MPSYRSMVILERSWIRLDSLDAVPRLSMRPRSFYKAWFEDWWLGELLTILSSCCLVIALCIILQAYNGQPVPSFGTFLNSGITLGTVVALLSTLAVAAVLGSIQQCINQLKWLWYSGPSRPLSDMEIYDQASRGLYGSVQLLWKLRLAPVASFGALLMITQLSIAPLTQQALVYELKSVPFEAGIATVVTINSWTEDDQQPVTGNTFGFGFDAISLGMKGAVVAGLFAGTNTTVNNVDPVCSSGNCTFPDYESLALCYSSADVTSHIQNLTLNATSRFCLFDSHCLEIKVNISDAVANMTSASNAVESQDGGLNFSSIAFSDHQSPLADIYLIYRNTSALTVTFGAVEFVLDWCVPTFSTNVISGIATTTRHPDPIMPSKGPTANSSLGVNVKDTEYTIAPDTHYSLQAYLDRIFSGALYYRGNDRWQADSDEIEEFAAIFGFEYFFGETHVDVDEPLVYGINQLNAILANTVTSMTNYMRTPGDWGIIENFNPDREKHAVVGTVYVEQSIVTIKWGWIVALAIFVASSLLFFIIVVAKGSRYRYRRGAAPLPLWKSSAIATLRAGEPQLQKSLGSMTTKSAMNESAREVYIHLVYDGSGWRLVGQGRPAHKNDDVALEDVSNASQRRISSMMLRDPMEESEEQTVPSVTQRNSREGLSDRTISMISLPDATGGADQRTVFLMTRPDPTEASKKQPRWVD